ncbi:MAG: aspartate aminotransferase family protein [Proteobacteria bacterium]|nr:aspartate aminotransferase family protein [Pseudomonadota bacterium]
MNKSSSNIPGPQSQKWIDRLALRECPAITARRSRRAALLGKADNDPIVWSSAEGSIVVDVDGHHFVDFTAGFGVAASGHRNPAVVQAAHRQLDRLIHAMGDAYPDPMRIQLLEKLALETGFERSILGCSGSDSIDAAIKTAVLATNRTRILAFDNSYHGLAFGALPATAYKSQEFRGPFQDLLAQHVDHIPYGAAIPDLKNYAAVLVEPIQGRGGIRVPPKGWLKDLIDQSNNAGTVVIFDEIYTGFGRTGSWFGFQDPSLEGRKPDILCIGKAMGGGFPISACIGTSEVMDAWGASKGEAIHTQTFLGNPLGCAMALANIEELKKITPTVTERSKWFQNELIDLGFKVQGQGFMLGIQHHNSLGLSAHLLQNGVIALPAGVKAEVLALTPPLVIKQSELMILLNVLKDLPETLKPQ